MTTRETDINGPTVPDGPSGLDRVAEAVERMNRHVEAATMVLREMVGETPAVEVAATE